MREIDIFSSVRLRDGRYCVIYSPDENDFFLPILIDGIDADIVEEWIAEGGIGELQAPVAVTKSVISELGGNVLYSEIKHDDDFGGLIGRVVCRQQNEVNEIFSMVNMPISYIMTFGVQILIDDRTILKSALNTAREVSDLIGINIEEVGVNDGKET